MWTYILIVVNNTRISIYFYTVVIKSKICRMLCKRFSVNLKWVRLLSISTLLFCFCTSHGVAQWMAIGHILTVKRDVVDSSVTSVKNCRIKFIKCQKTVMSTSPGFVRVFQILQVRNLKSYSVNFLGTTRKEKEREVKHFFSKLLPKFVAILNLVSVT
jgi:hypothetical protein